MNDIEYPVMYPSPVLKGVESGANILVLNVQYTRGKKLQDGSYSPDILYVVYRDMDTGHKKLQIIENPMTDIYTTIP